MLLEAAGCAGELLQGVLWLYPPLLSAAEELLELSGRAVGWAQGWGPAQCGFSLQ